MDIYMMTLQPWTFSCTHFH